MNDELMTWIENNNPYNEPKQDFLWNAKYFAFNEGAYKMAEHIELGEELKAIVRFTLDFIDLDDGYNESKVEDIVNRYKEYKNE